LESVVIARGHICCLALLPWSISLGALAQDIPSGYKVDRYARVWERNPFALAQSTTPERLPLAFEKLFLASWLSDGGKVVILVQNSETNEVQRITAVPNQNNLRLVELRANQNPQLVVGVISDGREQGTVKFRFDVQPFAGQTPLGAVGSNQVERTREPGSTLPATVPSSQSQGSSPTVTTNPGAAHSIYPGMPRVHHEGGPAPTPVLKQTHGKHFSPDSSAAQ
jgi:hypothetical protein